MFKQCYFAKPCYMFSFISCCSQALQKYQNIYKENAMNTKTTMLKTSHLTSSISDATVQHSRTVHLITVNMPYALELRLEESCEVVQ